MGSLQATEFASLVGNGSITLDAALTWHLNTNHLPPHPSFMVGVAKQAIEHVNNGDWDETVELPEGVSFRGQGRNARAGDLIEALHLDAFLQGEEYEGEVDPTCVLCVFACACGLLSEEKA